MFHLAILSSPNKGSTTHSFWGTEEPEIVYFTTKRGAKGPRKHQNHRSVYVTCSAYEFAAAANFQGHSCCNLLPRAGPLGHY